MNKNHLTSSNEPDPLTQKLDAWRQNHPKATLTEIEEAVEAELVQIRKQLVERMAVAAAATDTENICPHCGQKMVRNGRKTRRLKAKEGETIEIERTQWRCLGCGATIFPPG